MPEELRINPAPDAAKEPEPAQEGGFKMREQHISPERMLKGVRMQGALYAILAVQGLNSEVQKVIDDPQCIPALMKKYGKRATMLRMAFEMLTVSQEEMEKRGQAKQEGT